jgi:hypothetical protein
MYQVLVLSLATAAISVTVSRAQIFATFRTLIAEKSTWAGKLISCYYCTSHWVAIVFVLIYRPVLISRFYVVDLFVSTFSIVCIAALVGGIIIKLNLFRKPDESQQNVAMPSKKDVVF